MATLPEEASLSDAVRPDCARHVQGSDPARPPPEVQSASGQQGGPQEGPGSDQKEIDMFEFHAVFISADC